METEWNFVDTKNELGFGEEAELELMIEFDVTGGSPPGWEDPGEDPDVSFENVSLIKITTNKDEVINYDTLDPEKLAQVEKWAFAQVESCSEIFGHCVECGESYWEDYEADMKYEAWKENRY